MINIQEIEISKLKPYENNARLNDAAVEFVANSIKEFGMKNPIIVDKDMVIVAGHTRLKALQKLGMTKAPVIVADDLTEEQIKAYRIADNSTGQIAKWDLELLQKELDEIDYDMLQFGLEEQLNEIQKDLDSQQEVLDDGYEINLPSTPKSKFGDMYQLGDHILLCGDSTKAEDVRKLTGGGATYRPGHN